MTPAQEWQNWRLKRERGEVTDQEWLTWARRYVNGMSGGPWRSFCEQHIKFVERTQR